jgi:hypothetical protein
VATKDTTQEIAVVDRFLALNGDTARLREVLADNLAGTQLSVADLPAIKVPAGGGTTWEIPTAHGPEGARAIDALIVLHAGQRAFWFNPEAQQGVPPACTSDDLFTGTGDNDEGQGTHHCETCPQNEWGSKTGRDGQGVSGKACRETRIFYLLLPDMLLPVALRVPVTSLPAARQYLVSLSSQGLPYHKVVTRFALERVQNATGQPYSRVTFAIGPRLDDAAHERMLNLVNFYRPQLSKLRARDVAERLGADDA